MSSVIVIGANGRMGQLIVKTVQQADGLELVGTYDADNCAELDEVAPCADVAIDFSSPAALAHTLAYVRRTGAALVCGTTGLSAEQAQEIRAAGEGAPVIHAANYSLGVAALRQATAMVARALDGWDVEIVETHHNKKVDAPSGTARMLLEAVDPEGTGDVVYGREGQVGARRPREIGCHALRGGTVAGTHDVHFFGVDEEVCLTHRATSRQIFVSGAVAAAQRICGKPAGFYDFDSLMFGNDS